MTPSHLLKLPIELKLNILFNLSTSEIKRVGGVCSSLRALIKEPSNDRLLHQAAKLRASERLLDKVDQVASPYENENFFDFLFRMHQLRGVWQLPSNSERLMFFFIITWMRSVPAIQARIASDETGFLVDMNMSNALFKIGQALTQVHNNVQYPGRMTRRMVLINNGIDFLIILNRAWIPELGTCAGMTKMEVGGWYQQLVNQRPGTSLIPCAPSSRMAIPPFRLTSICHWQQDPEFEYGHPNYLPLHEGLCGFRQRV